MAGADTYADVDLGWVEDDFKEDQAQNAIEGALEAAVGAQQQGIPGQDLNGELALADADPAPAPAPADTRKGRGTTPPPSTHAIKQNLAAVLLGVAATSPLEISTAGRPRHSCTACKKAKTKCSFGRLQADDLALHEPCTYCANNGRKCVV